MDNQETLAEHPLMPAVRAFQNGQLDQARATTEALLAQHPDDFDTRHLLGVIYLRMDLPEQARPHLERAAALRPDNAQVQNALGALALRQGQLDAAREHFRQALARQPGEADASHNLAGLHLDEGDAETALQLIEAALAHHPEHPKLLAQRARARLLLGDLPGARDDYRHATCLQPTLARAWLGLGNVALQLGDLEEAEQALRQARELNGEDRESAALAAFNLGHLHYKRGAYDQALAHFQDAGDTPEARFGSAITALLMGDYARGWSLWRHRPSRSRPGPWSEPAPLDESGLAPGLCTLVHDEGVGDELFFLRFLPALIHRGWRPRYLPSAALRPLVRTLAGVELLPEDADLTALAEDGPVWLTGDLGALLDSGHRSPFPPPLPLTPEPARVEHWRAQLQRLGPPPYRGLTWHAGDRDPLPERQLLLRKRLPADTLTPLMALPGTWVAVGRHIDEGELARLRAAGGEIIPLPCEDMPDALALMALLDDYVAVPNTYLHLRASLGRRAAVLVPHPPEWRWGMMSEASPWFPDFTLYRQDPQGDWTAALDALCQRLAPTP